VYLKKVMVNRQQVLAAHLITRSRCESFPNLSYRLCKPGKRGTYASVRRRSMCTFELLAKRYILNNGDRAQGKPSSHESDRSPVVTYPSILISFCPALISASWVGWYVTAVPKNNEQYVKTSPVTLHTLISHALLMSFQHLLLSLLMV